MGAIKKDITLSDGTNVTLDISELRRKDWMDLWSGMEGENRVISKYTSIPLEQIKEMHDSDFRLLFDELVSLRNKPLANPNSQSAST